MLRQSEPNMHVPQRLIQSLIKGASWTGIFFTQIGNQYAVIGLTEEGFFNRTATKVDERAFLMSSHYFGMVLFAAPLTIFIKLHGLKKGFLTCLFLTAVANAIYPECVKVRKELIERLTLCRLACTSEWLYER